MRIQHNIMAMNAYRNYNANTSALSKNLEKLSSGYKINRAGDDAAGLAISEKMRAQITGLDAAQKNVKDGISLVKTGEGAMQEIHDMLNRMDYLATQSANGTYDDPVDRANLQKEVEALKSEIDRIADSANFNGIKLLDGSMEGGAIRGAEYTKVEADTIKGLIPQTLGTTQNDVDNDKTILEADGVEARKASFSVKLDNLKAADDATIELTVGNQTVNVAVTKDMGGSDIAKAAAEAMKNGITLKDDAGREVEFKVTADGNSLQFVAKKNATFNPPTDVSYKVTGALDPADDPTVEDSEAVLSATPYKNGSTTWSGSVSALNGATLPADLKTTVAVADGIATTNAEAFADYARDKGLEGGAVTVELGEDGVASLKIGNDVIATAAAATGDADSATGVSYSFTLGAYKDKTGADVAAGAATYTVTLKAAGATDVASDDLKNLSISTGYTVEKGDKVSGSFVADTTNMPVELGANGMGLSGDVNGELTLKYDANNDKWLLSAGGKTAELDGTNATVAAGVLTLKGADGATAIGTLTLKDAADAASTDAQLYDFQKMFSTTQIIGRLGEDAKVTGTLNGAVQNIQTGEVGGENRLANTHVALGDYMKQDGNKITLGDTTYTVALGAGSKFKDAKNVIDLTDLTGDEEKFDKIASTRLTAAAKENNGIFSVGHDNKGNTTLQQLTSAKDTTDMTTIDGIASYIGIEEAKVGSLDNVTTAQGLTLQIGDTSDSFNQLAVSIGDMHVAALGIADIDISTQTGAQAAVDVIKNAINQVSSVRGDLGAIQNRLEHTANNLSVMAENIQDAESTIRDTDVAQEMMAYTKNNILIQSAQAMLAQANAVPQGVLQLLG